MNKRGIIEINMSLFSVFFSFSIALLLIVYSYFYYGYKSQRMAYFSASYLSNVIDNASYQNELDDLNKVMSRTISENLEIKISARKTSKSNGKKIISEGASGNRDLECEINDDDIIDSLPSGATVDVVSICLYSPKYHISLSRGSFYISVTQ